MPFVFLQLAAEMYKIKLMVNATHNFHLDVIFVFVQLFALTCPRAAVDDKILGIIDKLLTIKSPL